MKHAGTNALDANALCALEDLLAEVRKFPDLREKKRGTFYRKSTAFLHFHEDPAGLFADLRVGQGWERLRVSTQAERKKMLAKLAANSTIATTAKIKRIGSIVHRNRAERLN
jgi:hypothetical protein